MNSREISKKLTKPTATTDGVYLKHSRFPDRERVSLRVLILNLWRARKFYVGVLAKDSPRSAEGAIVRADSAGIRISSINVESFRRRTLASRFVFDGFYLQKKKKRYDGRLVFILN